MKVVSLSALRADNPIGFLAALGTLRLIENARPEWQPKLQWLNQGFWSAALTLVSDLSLDDVVSAITDQIANRGNSLEFTWAKVIATTPAIFREHAAIAFNTARFDHRTSVDFFAAFGTEAALSGSERLGRDRKIKPTQLCMTSGQMNFLEKIREVCKLLVQPRSADSTDLRATMTDALNGPWNYSDDQHSLFWDPTNEAIHALSAYDPSGKGKQTSMREVVYLAAESLSFFPVVSRKGKVRTTCFFTGEDDEPRFHWPVWECPLSHLTIRSLLQLAELEHPAKNELALNRRGVQAVFRSRRQSTGKDYGMFRPAEPFLTSLQPFFSPVDPYPTPLRTFEKRGLRADQ